RLKTTTVYVTHDQIEAMTMADRIVVMHDGIVEQVGRPLELYDQPVNTFVAGFLGSPAMNLLPGRIRREGGKVLFELESGGVIALPADSAGEDGRPLLLGIRPEHIAIAPGGDAGFAARAVVTEPTGAETLITTRIGDTDL